MTEHTILLKLEFERDEDETRERLCRALSRKISPVIRQFEREHDLSIDRSCVAAD